MKGCFVAADILRVVLAVLLRELRVLVRVLLLLLPAAPMPEL